MKQQTRLCSVFLMLLLLLTLMPLQVSANGPVPAMWYDIRLSNLPEGTVYVDLLIPLPEDDPMYVALMEENLPAGFTEQAQIVTYCADGFRSYTFHYRDALSVMEPGLGLNISFGAKDEQVYDDSNYRYGHLEDIQKRGVMRLAMLDAAGNILQVSDDLAAAPRGRFSFLIGSCFYNAATGNWIMDTYVSPLAVTLYVILSALGILLTCLIERLMAWPFGLGIQYGTAIWRTNLVSQLAMRVLYLVLYSLLFRSHGALMIALEILVYGGEYLFYHLRMKNVTWRRKLLYTAAANTASLVICYRINQILLYS